LSFFVPSSPTIEKIWENKLKSQRASKRDELANKVSPGK